MEVCVRRDAVHADGDDINSQDCMVACLPIQRSTPSGTKRSRDFGDGRRAETVCEDGRQESRDKDRALLPKRARTECPSSSWSDMDLQNTHAVDRLYDDSCVPTLSPVAWLSDEIRLHIARYCSLVDLARLASVSRDWRRVASDPRLCARLYDLHVGRCRFDHLCHGVTTDVVSDPAFFTRGLAALDVPDDAVPSETVDPAAGRSDPTSAPEAVPSWAMPIGRALAACCARIARSAAETRGRGTLYDDVDPLPSVGRSGNDDKGLQTCRHVPPTFVEAFGVGAAYRASIVGPSNAYNGPRFWHDPADSGSRPRYARPMGAYMWPCRISASPPRHTACLYTDGPRYFNETDVTLALMLADADGRTLWAHAWSRSTADVTVDDVVWYCAGPFPPRVPLRMDLTIDNDDKVQPARTPRLRFPSGRVPLLVSRRSDGSVTCARAGKRINHKTGVRSALYDATGPCLMETAGARAIYRGGLSMGVRSGHGLVRTADGTTIYEGLWEDDLPSGEGKLYDAARRLVFSGTFNEGMPGNGSGLLCVRPSPTCATPSNTRPCKVYAEMWAMLRKGGRTRYAVPRGDGHVILADGTRLDCRWSHTRQPPSVLRVHVSARSALSFDGRPCVLDLTVAPPSFYDEALALLDDVDNGNSDRDDDVNGSVSDATRRRRARRAAAVAVEKGRRRHYIEAWRQHLPSDLVATCPSRPRGIVPEPCEWIGRALASASLSFAVDLAPHRTGRLVVNLLDAFKQT
ncbi:F-box domain containing protein [Pandoravirus neocaledonia]|uniref:F-box domain containing protein n=1 Tax=Pandoravirus neocaledonia TaxID=2107708 RepID=A0A2U7UDP8_9VIRU|nr:F-box domain containing protein [Pandoravirus neocaledonia]AVK76557.1 F-box domain containing protein [Pandoravirus neocaledonia]